MDTPTGSKQLPSELEQAQQMMHSSILGMRQAERDLTSLFKSYKQAEDKMGSQGVAITLAMSEEIRAAYDVWLARQGAGAARAPRYGADLAAQASEIPLPTFMSKPL